MTHPRDRVADPARRTKSRPPANGHDGEALPHSIEAEQALLGSLLLDTSAWDQVADMVRTKDFFRPDHQRIFAAIASLVGEGTPCDVITVSERLQKLGELDNAGGLAYLGTLARNTPTAANIASYASVVSEKARLRRFIELGATFPQLIAKGATSEQITTALRGTLDSLVHVGRPRAMPLDWSGLAGQTPPEREWIEQYWLGRGYVTGLWGAGGIGKTGLAQAWGSCLALRRSYLDWVPSERRVLMWACEDDEAELWRRQDAIAQWLGVPLSDFTGRLHLYSYCDEQVELAGPAQQHPLVPTPMLARLREQIGDHRADVVILDNIARLYGGNENDRHQVSSFVAMLTAAAKPTQAGVLLLGHPGKAAGSEYSGSTAWEGAVRARLYLGATLPDQKSDSETPPADDSVRYLCRRKANYSARDWRRVVYREGVMVPDPPPEPGTRGAGGGGVSDEYARDIVLRAIRRLAEMNQHCTASTSSPLYLPRLAAQYELLDRLTERQFGRAMRSLQMDGSIITTTVGQYGNRTPRQGLVIAPTGDPA